VLCLLRRAYDASTRSRNHESACDDSRRDWHCCGKASSATSAQIRERVVTARRRQQERFAGKRSVTCNARMGTRDLKAFCALDETTLELLKMAMNELKLSARAYDRILKVARTIADLAGSDRLTADHLSEAIQYRSLDRQLWA
jgi:magnesium chelatase family protein